MAKVSDFIFEYIGGPAKVDHVFMISGGGNMHLVDSAGRTKGLKYVCNHHEQACAIAAECYARITGNLGVCLVTTGPGATNAITGTLGAWLDSIPVLYISGQVKREVQIGKTHLRQLGDQEVNIIDMIKPITKYAAMVDDPSDIGYHLEKAIFLAKSGRPGPVWLDIPLDIQGAIIDPEKMKKFDPAELAALNPPELSDGQMETIIEKLKKAERPVLFVGNGIRLANGQKELDELVEKLKIPVLCSFAGFDQVDSANPYYYGRPSVLGHRSANFILQNSDLLLSVGSRLNLRIVTFNWKAFARQAYKIVVDVDAEELRKKTISPDMALHADAKVFLTKLLEKLPKEGLPEKTAWLEYGKKMSAKYPVILPEQRAQKDYIHSHSFIEKLSGMLKDDAIVISGDGLACESLYRAFKVKHGQRVIINSGCASMGYDLPAAIGACFANGEKELICVTGDGSTMLNLQELQTMVHHKLPIKIFLFENQGYLSIRRTQDGLFKGFHVASDPASGVTCPDFIKVAQAFGLPTETIRIPEEAEEKMKKVLSHSGPVLCVVHVDPNEKLIPKLASKLNPDGSMVSPPLEDMFPFLDREEFKSNMIIEPMKESL